MRRNLVLLVLTLALAPGLTSCQKIGTGTAVPGGTGPLVAERSPSGDAIPLAYGELVGITPDPTNPWQAVLWFKGTDQAVTAVWVNTGQRRVAGSLKIPRR